MDTRDDDDLPGEAVAPEPAPTPGPPPPPAAPAKPALKIYTPPPESEPAPAKPKHPSRLVQLALREGMDPRELDDWPTTQLWEEVSRLRDLRFAARPNEAPQRPSAPPPPPPPAPEPDPLDEFEKEGADPLLLKALRKADERAKAAQRQTDELAERLAQRDRADEERTTRSLHETLDAAFAALGPQYEAVFGKGPIASFSPEMKGQGARRLAVLHLGLGVDPKTASPAQVFAAVRKNAEELFGEFHQYRPPEAPPPPPPSNRHAIRDPETNRFVKRPTAEDYEAGQLARPAGRVDPPGPGGPAAAKKKVADWFSERGLEPGPIPKTDNENDDLPA